MSHVPEGLSPVVNIDGIDRYRPSMEEVRGLAWRLGSMVSLSSFEIKYLVGVTRGGLTIADCVSRKMNVKDIQTLAIEVYEEDDTEGSNPEKPAENIRVYRVPKLSRKGEGALFVDDVLDTGTTAGFIRENWPKAAIGATYTKKPHRPTLEEIDFYGKYVGNIWIDFPWEREAQAREEIRSSDPSMII
jgi:xanthine phosphoribosyltransferase